MKLKIKNEKIFLMTKVVKQLRNSFSNEACCAVYFSVVFENWGVLWGIWEYLLNIMQWNARTVAKNMLKITVTASLCLSGVLLPTWWPSGAQTTILCHSGKTEVNLELKISTAWNFMQLVLKMPSKQISSNYPLTLRLRHSR